MSKCISLHGEYSEHETIDGFACARCHVFDEEAALTRIGILEAALASTPSPAQPICGATISSPHKVCEQVPGHVGMHGRPGYFWASPAQPTEAIPAPAEHMQHLANRTPEPDCVWCQSWVNGLARAGFRLAPSPVQGADDLPPERDATPDEAFELGRVAGYDEAMREGADDRLAQVLRDVTAIASNYLSAVRGTPPYPAEVHLRNLRDASRNFLATYQQSPQAALNEVRAQALEEAAVWLEKGGRFSAGQHLRARAAELRGGVQAGAVESE